MSIAVRANALDDNASALEQVAATLDDMLANIQTPAISGGALAGVEMQDVEAAFEDLWRRCARDLTTRAEAARRVSATVRGAAEAYRETDGAVASKARMLARGL